MANVRDYLKEKEKRIDYKEKIRSHKLAIFYRIVLFLLLTAAIAAFVFIQWRDKVFTESIITGSAYNSSGGDSKKSGRKCSFIQQGRGKLHRRQRKCGVEPYI